ncbi:MAG: glycerol-3-phosphate 1-O-acyltransferase PlsB, partial [Gammaproteobacteria bacterium]|nr:glycerol-3-phosphate 1-O-acyltransferase PlsB [Gammaproteobacteria bacterium]
QVVPVSLFWGRSPDKEKSAIRLLFAETWERMGILRRFFRTIFYGRQVVIQFSKPIDLESFLHDGLDNARRGRKLARVFRVHFRRTRKAAIGPDKRRRHAVIEEVVSAPSVQNVINKLQSEKKPREKLEKDARKFVKEIAATYSHNTVRFLEGIFDWLWNKRYDGIKLEGVNKIRELAANNQVVYVPNHRSHIDYLLLSYVMYKEGLMPPHVAAGINLNMPVIGKILRNAGAFFMRRTFAGNQLYSTVFREYMKNIQQDDTPTEYFIEGGRSRTGRMLPAKAGLLSMSTRAFLQDPEKPLVFVPVFVGYEKLWEGKSYLKELGGKAKKKESVGGLLRALKSLRGGKMGHVHASFGAPIDLREHIQTHAPNWGGQSLAPEAKPDWLVPTVNALGNRILTSINSAAVLDPMNLLSYVLLSTPRLNMGESELARQIDKLIRLQKLAPYSPELSVPDMYGKEIVEYVKEFDFLELQEHALGNTLTPIGRHSVLMSYYRNNIQHVFAIPSLLASIFLDNKPLSQDRVVELVDMVYPYIKQELFLRYQADGLPAVVDAQLKALHEIGYLDFDPETRLWSRCSAESAEAAELENLAQGMLQTLGRFYLLLVLMVRHGKHGIKQGDLENLVHLSAQRMSRLQDISSPEFFDKRLFQGFIRLLKENELITLDEKNMLRYGRSLIAQRKKAEAVLSERFRQVIFRVINA